MAVGKHLYRLASSILVSPPGDHTQRMGSQESYIIMANDYRLPGTARNGLGSPTGNLGTYIEVSLPLVSV